MHDETHYVLVTSMVLGLGLILLRPAGAQQPAAIAPPAAATGQEAVASAAADRAQLENYVRVMKSEEEQAETRAKAVTAQLVALDGDIESRVDRIVSLLSSVRDSADTSGSRLRKAKEEALAGLKATAVFYAQQRDNRKKEMGNRYAQIDSAELAKDVAALNARIETRVKQALEIAESLAQHNEGPVNRYQNTDTDTSAETKEYRRVARDANASADIKTKLVADLRKSIEKLTRDTKAREEELRATTDPQKQAQLTTDIETMRRTIEARRSQIEELMVAPKPATRAVSSKAAFEMDKMLDEMTLELKSDFAKFRVLANERDAARARVKPLKERLEKATAMLEKKQPGD